MSHPQHPASPPSPYPGSTFQRIRRPGGNPAGHRGQPHWIMRALYGATSFSLLAGPVHAGGYYKEHGPSRATVEATDGDPDRVVRVQGPVVTRGEREYGIQALQAGSVVLTGPVVTSGGDAYAVYYSGAARVMMTDVDITTTGDRAHAVQGFRGRGPGLPDWAASRQGSLEWLRGTITLQGQDSIGMDITAPVARLGQPLQATDPAKLWSMGYTRQASAQEPDVRIDGQGMRNTGIAIKGHRRLELNGVGIALQQAGAVGMSVGAAARVDGRNIGIAASGIGSFGLRVRGDDAPRDDAARCPLPTSVKLANGFITMTGRDSPAVELTRAELALEDITITTAQGARFAVGNEAGIFRMEGKQARAVIRGTGSALAAWTANDRETARFEFRNVSIHSGSHSLLEVGRDSGDAGPALPAHANLSMDGGTAQGRIWSSIPAARVDVTLQRGASWQGSTDIGKTITVASQGTWQMDADSTVENVVMDQGTISFHERAPLVDQPSGPSAAGRQTPFHRLHVLREMRGNGLLQMRVNAANGESDKIVVNGSATGNVVIGVRHTGAATETVKAIDVLHAAQGGPAIYTLPDRAKRVFLAQRPFQLHKETARDNPSVIVWLVPEGMPFARNRATIDLEPDRGEPVVLAQMRAAYYGETIESSALPASPDKPIRDTGITDGIRGGFDTIHLPPPRDEPTVVAETPAGFYSTVDTIHLPPPQQPIVLAETPAEFHGTVDTMDIVPPKQPSPATPAPPPTQHAPMPTTTTVDMEVPVRVIEAPIGTKTEIVVLETDGGDRTEKDTTESGKRKDEEIEATAGGGNGDGAGHGDNDGDGDGGRDGDVDRDDEGDEGDEGDKDDKDGKDEKADDADEAGDDAENENEETTPPAPVETATAAPPTPVALSPGAKVAVNNAALAAGQGIWNAQLGAINRQLRTTRGNAGVASPTGIHALDGAGTGIWIDATDGRQKIDNPLTGEYRQDLYGFVAGIDRAIDVDAGRWHIGLLAAQAESKRDFNDGKGSTRSVHLGGYATFLGPQGSYATAIVAVGRYRHRMHGQAANDARFSGDFRNQGAGASVEAGRRVELPRGWFAEPYAGVDYLRVGSARYTLSDGTSVRDHGGHSLQGRVGSRAGRVIDTGNGNTVTPYLRAGYAYEQGNHNRITVNGTTLNADLGGSRLETGVGVEARLGRGHSLYVDYGYAKGRRLDQAQAVTVGFQYRW